MNAIVPARPAYLDHLAAVEVDGPMRDELAERRVPLGLFRARAAWLALRAAIDPAQAVARLYREVIAAPPGPVYLMPPSVERALMASQKIVALFGPARTGKTRGVCMYVYEHCRKYAAKYTGDTIRWLFVRDTYESIRQTTLKSWLDLFPPTRYGVWNEQKKTYTVRLPKGQRAEVQFAGLDDAKDVARLQSLDLTGFVIEEPAGGLDEAGNIQPGVPEHVYRGLIPRLSHPPAMILERVRGIVLGNTGSTAHWTFRTFRPDLPQPHEETLCVHVPEEESPVPAEYYAGLTRDLRAGTPEELRYRRGHWLAALTGGLHRELFPIIPRDQVPEQLAFGATCDPAAGGKGGTGDRSAIVVAGFAPDLTAYVFKIIAGRLPESDLLARIFEVQAAYPLGAFGFEAVAFSAWLQFMVEQERQNRMLRGQTPPMFNLVGLSRNSKVKKDTRIQGSLGARLAATPPRLYLVEGCGDLEALWEEVAVFGQEKGHDDVLDALSDLDEIAPHCRTAVDVGHVAAPAPDPRHQGVTTGAFWPRSQGGFWRGRAA